MKQLIKDFIQALRPIQIEECLGEHRPRPLAKMGALSTLRQIASMGLTVFSAVILSRLLPPSTFGLVAMVAFFRGIMQVFTAKGFIESAIQKKNVSLNDINGLFWMNVMVSSLLAFIFVVCAPLIAGFYGEPVLAKICLVFALLFMLENFFMAHNAILRRAMLEEISFVMFVVARSVGVAMSIVMALLGFGVWALVGGLVFSAITSRILFLYFLRWSPGGFKSSPEFRGMFRYGIGASSGTIVNYLTNFSQNLALGKFASAADVGFFSRGQTLFMVPTTQMMAPISGLMLPALSSMQDNREKMLDLILRAQWLIVLAIMPFTLFVAVYGDWLVPWLLGEQWGVSGEVAQWLAVASVPILLGNMLSRGNAAIGRPGRGALIAFIGLPPLLTGVFFLSTKGAVAVAVFYAIYRWIYYPPVIVWHLRGSGFNNKLFCTEQVKLISLTVLAYLFLFGMKATIFSNLEGSYRLAVFAISGSMSYFLMFLGFRLLPNGRYVLGWINKKFFNNRFNWLKVQC